MSWPNRRTPAAGARTGAWDTAFSLVALRPAVDPVARRPLAGLGPAELPAWVRELLDKAKYVVPVVVAFVLARGEVRRRRAQDERKQAADAQRDGDDVG